MTDREAVALSGCLSEIERLAGGAAGNVIGLLARDAVGDRDGAAQYRRSLAQRCAAILECADRLREMVPDAGNAAAAPVLGASEGP